MEFPVKVTALVGTAILATSAQAFAHSGHVPAAGSVHAVQHAGGDWLVAAMALLAFGVAAMITARIRIRGH
jgi:hypothetical protein